MPSICLSLRVLPTVTSRYCAHLTVGPAAPWEMVSATMSTALGVTATATATAARDDEQR